MTQEEKDLSWKNLEEVMKSVGFSEYPKYLGNGVWELGKGVYSNERAVEELNKAIVEQVKKDDRDTL
jgi:hypothetical protein